MIRREGDRSYVVRRDVKEYFRTREHIKPRQCEVIDFHIPMPIPVLTQPLPMIVPDSPVAPPVVQHAAPPPAPEQRPMPTTNQTGTTGPVTTRPSYALCSLKKRGCRTLSHNYSCPVCNVRFQDVCSSYTVIMLCYFLV